MSLALAWTLAALAAAQSPSPMPYSGEEAPAASTAPAVAVSTPAAKAEEKPKPKPKTAPRLHAVIHPEAKDWQPLSLRAGNVPAKARFQGKAVARVHKRGEDVWLVISVFPAELEKKHRHFEIRFRIVEGYVENVQAAQITAAADLDTDELRAQGVEFEEESPASGQIVVSALDPRPSKTAVNAGFWKRDDGSGVLWSATGLR